jgi:hypothetical protein
MAEPVSKKSPGQILLEKKAIDLKTILSNLAPNDPIRPRKEAGLKSVESELAALAVK